jgi:hypothetical protein
MLGQTPLPTRLDFNDAHRMERLKRRESLSAGHIVIASHAPETSPRDLPGSNLTQSRCRVAREECERAPPVFGSVDNPPWKRPRA